MAVSLYAQKGTVLPSAVRIGTDLGFAGVSLFDPDKTVWELNADIDVYKLFITADYGVAQWNMNETDFKYESKGSYFKVGIDYNLLARDPELNVIYLGFKYANSKFKENFQYFVADPFYSDYEKSIAKTDQGAYWIEGHFGMKIRIWKQLYLGWAGRIKFAKKEKNVNSSLGTYYIPGYGKADSDSRWGFNYQIFYRIPFREKPPYKPKKVKEQIQPEPVNEE